MEITNDIPVKIKDPKRVEAGKRLAAISKTAKEAKAARLNESVAQVSERSEDTTSDNDSVSFVHIVGFIGAIAGVGALYFAFRQDRRINNERSEARDNNESIAREVDNKSTLDTL